MTLVQTVLAAARADSIPAGESGLWSVFVNTYPKNILGYRNGKLVEVPAGTYRYLYRYTEAKALHNPPGDLVMHDTPDELKTHLQFMLRASGNVLITGLGLGCVARGCLANPAVSHVTIVENSPDVLKLVRPYMPADRLTIIEQDAVDYCQRLSASSSHFDCAWHDLWSDPNDPAAEHLHVIHSHLIRDCAIAGLRRVGAWSFPKEYGSAWLRREGVGI